ASPAWSIRCSRLKSWFLAYGNKEIYRLECVVFHARDSCKFFQACKRFNMMPPPGANPLNRFVLTSNLYETNKKIEYLATGVVIAEGKHNMSIIESSYDKLNTVVNKVMIMDDSKGTELKKKLRDTCFHKNLVAFLGCETVKICGMSHCQYIVDVPDGKLKDLQDIARVILYIVSKGVHLLKDVVAVNPGLVDEKDLMKLVGTNAEDVVAVNPGLVDEKDLMKLVGTNAEVIDLLKKIGIVQLQTSQPRYVAIYQNCYEVIKIKDKKLL
nr:hypothetical protein [Tanacetum cinerariifolium]